MNIRDFCNCEKHSSIYTVCDDWYQYDICSDCEKVLEDGIRPLDDNGNY